MSSLDEAFAPIVDMASEQRAPEWKPILPVPRDAPRLTRSTTDRFGPPGMLVSKAWRYFDAEGDLLGCILRYELAIGGVVQKKEYRPFTFCVGPDGRREWRCQSFPKPRPLYGLHHLAARPDALVIVVEGEKTADAARTRFPDLVAITSPGGSNAAHQADWSPLAGRIVTIWRDADDAGTRYQNDVVNALRTVNVASLKTVSIPDTFPPSWDLADPPPNGVSDAVLDDMLASAKLVQGDEPLPLYPKLARSESYPLEALGPMLAPAAAAIARKIGTPEAIAGQSVLATASLAAQIHADIKLPFGQTRPLSLYLVTVAASGDRKTSADNEALWPIRKYELKLKVQSDLQLQTWLVDHAAWSAEKRTIEGKRGLDRDSRKQALLDLGPEPERPLHPILTLPDPTVEGLAKAWPAAPASLGIFTAEGGQFIGGHGMSQDNRLKTAAAYSELWDGRAMRRVRASDGVTILPGRRISMHIMVQPEAATIFLSDATLRDQGLLSRMLVAAPESIGGTRFYRESDPSDDAAIRTYGGRILSILEANWPVVAGKRNELEPRTITIDAAAEVLWRDYYNHIETQCGPEGELALIRDFAAKAAEHAARIAGVLTLVADLRASTVDAVTMHSAVALTDWHVNEALRLHQAARTDPRLLRADQLLEWWKKRPDREIDFREILQRGPNPLRTKAAAEDAVSVLIAHHWVVELTARPRRLKLLG